MRFVGRTRRTVLVVACVAAVVLLAVFINGLTRQNKPLADLSKEKGEPAVAANWPNLLADEQKAALDKAYKESVESGYEGDEDEWVASQVRYREKDVDVVTFVLPNGTELDVKRSEVLASNDENLGAGKDVEDSGEIISLGEWYGELGDDELAAIDIAYEQSVENGWQGTKEEWLASEVNARHDHAGDVLVKLPDGGEFVVSKRDSKGQSNVSEDTKNADDQESNESDGSAQVSDDETGASIFVQTAKAKPGQSDVPVSVSIEHNPGILGLELSVEYDEDAMTLRSAESGEAIKDALTMTHSKGYASGCVFAWDGVEVKAEDVKDGTILTLYFDITSDAKNGTYPITVQSEGTAVNNDLQEVAVSIHDGNVTIEQAE